MSSNVKPYGDIKQNIISVIYTRETTLIDLLLKFADDTKGIKKITNEADSKNLQKTLDKLFEWSIKWGMKFNVE